MNLTSPRKLGKSKLVVNPLGFGGGILGDPRIDNATCLNTVRAAWDAGSRLFDTAPFYGIGRSERRMGMALSDINAWADCDINTKVGRSLVAEPVRNEAKKTLSQNGQTRTVRDPLSGFRVDFNYSHDRILAQHNDSLQRLGTASVSSLTIHDLDHGYHLDHQIEQHLVELSKSGGGGAEALENLRNAGVIKAIGFGCNFEARSEAGWDSGKYEALVERTFDTVDLDFLIMAGAYTLLETRAMSRILPLCQERGIGIICASTYCGGWLIAPDEKTDYMYGTAPGSIVAKAKAMQKICRQYDVPLAAVGLQFQLAHPLVAAIIPGAKSPEEVASTQQNALIDIPTGLWADFKAEGLLEVSAPVPNR